MTYLTAFLIAVTLLTPAADRPHADDGRKARAAFILEADEGVRKTAKTDEHEKEFRIRSVRSDFDRLEGVAMFEGRAIAQYDKDFTLTADRIFAFLVASNRLQRVVATGHVTVTNEARYGGAAMATFTKDVSVVNLYGDKTAPAWLKDPPNAVAGSRIRFKVDSEQVEVTQPVFSVVNTNRLDEIVK